MIKRRVISVVDDEAEVLRATSSLLRSCGYEVATFSSAEEFLNSPGSDCSACVVSDIHMPGISGIDMFVLLDKRPSPPPVIFITAFAEPPIPSASRSPVCVLKKPYVAEALIACIERAIGEQGIR